MTECSVCYYYALGCCQHVKENQIYKMSNSQWKFDNLYNVCACKIIWKLNKLLLSVLIQVLILIGVNLIKQKKMKLKNNYQKKVVLCIYFWNSNYFNINLAIWQTSDAHSDCQIIKSDFYLRCLICFCSSVSI